MASPKFDPNWSSLPAGTEVPELRTSTSRTYSNGDGTFTADIAPMRLDGGTSQYRCRPTHTGFIQYWWDGHTYYHMNWPEMEYNVEDAVSFAKFDLTPIPDSSTVLDAQFRCYQYYVASAPVRTGCTHIGLDPDSASPGEIYLAVRSGNVLAETSFSGIGWLRYHLGAQGISILQGLLPQDWMMLGIKPITGWAVSYGITGDDFETYLYVVYLAPGIEEPFRMTSRRSELAIAPNPATGGFAMARCDIEAGMQGMLTLRGVLGRAVKSFPLSPSGCTLLDLRGLAPGVYMATLEAGTQSLTRKLVITAR